jgi:hypothetical protein
MIGHILVCCAKDGSVLGMIGLIASFLQESCKVHFTLILYHPLIWKAVSTSRHGRQDCSSIQAFEVISELHKKI